MFDFKKLKSLDWVLISVTILVFAMGIIVIYSTTSSSAGFDVARNQIINGVIGFLLMIFIAFLDYRSFKSFTHVMYAVTVGLLLYVLVTGKISHGATRWIDLGFFQLQPSEIAKFVMVVVLAKYFSKKGERMADFSSIIVSLIYIGIPVLLVMAQPDLGTAMVLMAIWLGMILVTQVRKIYMLGLGLFTLISMPFVFNFLKDYQKKRILIFLNSGSDPQGAGYNVLQSTISIGSGKLFGRGLGHGPQSQLKFLPERYTDFAFAVLGEELGLAGGIILLALFVVMIIRILRVAKLSSDAFGSYLAIGVAVWIIFQIFINMGMNIGIAPITGVPLPLVSFGGSSVIAILFSFGLLQSVLIRNKKLNFRG